MPKVSAGYLAARREQIAQAASRLFAERGFSRTTMADVGSGIRAVHGRRLQLLPQQERPEAVNAFPPRNS